MTDLPVDIGADDQVAEATWREPARHWYKVALLIAAVGVIGGFAWVSHAVASQKEAVSSFTDLAALDVAAGTSVEIATPGVYTVWTGSSCAGFCRPSAATTTREHLSLELDGPADVVISPFDGAQYFNHGAGGEGRAVWTVRFDEAGSYELRLVDDGELPPPRLWLGRGDGMPVRVFRGALGIGGTALALSTVLSVVAFTRRRRFYAEFSVRQRARSADGDPSPDTDVEALYDSVGRWEQAIDGDEEPAGGVLDDESFDTNLGVLTKRLNRPDAEAGPLVAPTTPRPTTPPTAPGDAGGPSATTADPAPAATDAATATGVPRVDDSQLGALTKRFNRSPAPVPAPVADDVELPAPVTTAAAKPAEPTALPTPEPEPVPVSAMADDRFDSSLGVLAKRMNRTTADPSATVTPPEPAPTPDAPAPAAADHQFDSALGVLAKRLSRTAPAPVPSPDPPRVPVSAPQAPPVPAPVSALSSPVETPSRPDSGFDATVGVLTKRLNRATTGGTTTAPAVAVSPAAAPTPASPPPARPEERAGIAVEQRQDRGRIPRRRQPDDDLVRTELRPKRIRIRTDTDDSEQG